MAWVTNFIGHRARINLAINLGGHWMAYRIDVETHVPYTKPNKQAFTFDFSFKITSPQ